jgi:hypothetical protein
MAMLLNPVIKLAYIEASWDSKYLKMAQKIVEYNVSNIG